MINHSATWAPVDALTSETALAVLAQGLQKITQATTPFTIDLEKISAIDSVGVAVLLEWQRFANNRQAKLVLVNAPEKLRSMLHLAELDNILNLT